MRVGAGARSVAKLQTRFLAPQCSGRLLYYRPATERSSATAPQPNHNHPVVCIWFSSLCPDLANSLIPSCPLLQNGRITCQASRARRSGPQRVLAQGPSRAEAVNTTEPDQGVRGRATNGTACSIACAGTGVEETQHPHAHTHPHSRHGIACCWRRRVGAGCETAVS